MIARMTARIDAHTEVAPFTPQSHGVIAGSFSEASFIPRGKAVPKQKPMGTRIMAATRIRTVVEDSSKCLMMGSVVIPNKKTIVKSNRRQIIPDLLISGVVILPVR